MFAKPNILVIDDELGVRESFRMTLKDNYNVLTATNGREGLEAIKQGNLSLVILDVRMPDINGIEILKQVRERYPQLPVIVLTGAGTHRIALEAIKLGAADFIVKPINVVYVRKTIADTLNNPAKKISEEILLSYTEETLKNEYLATLRALSREIESREPYTQRHSERVTKYAVELAKELGLSAEEIEIMEQTALLHDIGKIEIEDKILHKPDKLSSEEWETMKKHPLKGEEMLHPLKLLHIEQTMVRHHHERFDGSGYPDKLKGEEIPIYARILAVADAFEAMISGRPYRSKLSLQEAKKELERYKGIQFDPKVVEAFLRVLEKKDIREDKMSEKKEVDKEKKRILLIDDDEHIFMAIKAIFKEQYQLCYAKDGRKGCEEAKLFRPHLIILDSRMAGISGKQTLFALREQDDKVPIVFLTAFPEDVMSQLGNLGNVSCFVVKPFDADKLTELVDNLVKDYEY